MKLTMILLIAASLHVSATGFGQKVSISGKDLPLEKVFSMIKKQTGYVFFYDYSIFQGAKNVTLDLKDVEIDEAMRACLRGQGLEFSITNKTISIVKKPTPPPTQMTDPKTPPEVKGVVRADNGIPLAGATVFIRKLNKSGATNAEGEFILHDVPNGKYSVEISYIGYDKYVTEIVVENHEVRIAAEMRLATGASLDQAVVKGYYTTTKRLNTGNVTTVKSEDIQKQPVSDPILALEGRVSGLYVQQTSGAPGAYSTIRIRGKSSIANGTDPLYIIDGVPFSSTSLTSTGIGGGMLGSPLPANGPGLGMSPFNSLNPSDIESIEVLKDADATAIYGSRGANGVILITTKKGKSGNTKVDVNVFSGNGKVTRKLDLMNTQQYLQMRHEAFANDGNAPGSADYDVNGFWDSTRYTDWQKVLIGNTAHFTNAQANISGGNINTQFVIGGGYARQGTVFPGNYLDEKESAHMNLTHTSTDRRLHVQISANYNHDNNTLPSTDFTSNILLAPDAPALYLSNGNLNWQPKNVTSTWVNPIAATTIRANAKTDNLISNLNLSYQLFSGLQLQGNFGYNHIQMNQTIQTPAISVAPPNNNNPARRINSFATTDFSTWIVEPQLNYRKKISKGLLEVLVGTSFQENVQNSLSQRSSGFASDALIPNPLAATTTLLLGKTNALYHYNAVYGRLSYNWEDKYIVNATARRDGSSRFGPGKQFGNFGAVGAAWIFSKEKFIENTFNFLSFGKIRASYGSTGNDQIPDYQYLSTYTPNGLTYQGLVGLSPTQMPNPYFGWELVKKLEGGIELGFLKDRILFSASYYRNRTGNQLVGYPLPFITGFYTVQANLPAVIQNTGVELTSNIILIRNKDFNWTSAINLTLPSNKLVAYPNIENSTYNTTYVVGQSIFSKLVYRYTGVDPQTGVYTVATKDPAGNASSQDYVSSRPLTQKYYGGFENSFTYRGFQLDVFIQFVKQLGTSVDYSLSLPGVSKKNLPTYELARWQNQGDKVNVQKFSTGINDQASNAFFNLYRLSNGVIVDASFVRLKNVSLSYQLPQQWMRKAHMQTSKLYIQCQNLITITNYHGLDPETGALNLPPLRMITAGIQVSL